MFDFLYDLFEKVFIFSGPAVLLSIFTEKHIKNCRGKNHPVISEERIN